MPTPDSAAGLEAEKLKLEIRRLDLERAKLAVETRLKRREERHHSQSATKAALSNPLVLAVVGGSLTLFTSIVTTYLTASANREADQRRATEAQQTESRNLQSELIKSFLKTEDSKTARDNLTFLIESGLIPDHESRIKKYLEDNTKTVPKIADTQAPSPTTPACPTLDVGPLASVRPQGKPLGVSLHLATNRLDPNAYGGWDGRLQGAVPDATAMQKLAQKLGYRTHVLVSLDSSLSKTHRGLCHRTGRDASRRW